MISAAVLVLAALWLVRSGFLAYAAALAFALHLAWQVRAIPGAAPMMALRLFRSNRDAGLILGLGLALAGLVKAL